MSRLLQKNAKAPPLSAAADEGVSGKNMKHIVTTLLFLFTLPCWSFDYAAIEGQWAIYHSNLTTNDDYYFLNINKDLSGTLVRSLGHEPITRKFSSNDVTKRNGYIEIHLNNNEKAVLSAWKSKSGNGRLNGLIYMYKESGELFNTLYFPLQLLKQNHKFLSHEKIKYLSNKHR